MGDGLGKRPTRNPCVHATGLERSDVCGSWVKDKAPDRLLAADVNKGVGRVLDSAQ